jgi:hypothetical protein
MTRGECLARRLWDLAQSGDCRWAVHLLLNRWLGRLPMHVDLQQQVTLDLTASLDPSTLARYRWLVQHEDSLTLTKSENCSNSACSGVPLLAPGDSHDL